MAELRYNSEVFRYGNQGLDEAGARVAAFLSRLEELRERTQQAAGSGSDGQTFLGSVNPAIDAARQGVKAIMDGLAAAKVSLEDTSKVLEGANDANNASVPRHDSPSATRRVASEYSAAARTDGARTPGVAATPAGAGSAMSRQLSAAAAGAYSQLAGEMTLNPQARLIPLSAAAVPMGQAQETPAAPVPAPPATDLTGTGVPEQMSSAVSRVPGVAALGSVPQELSVPAAGQQSPAPARSGAEPPEAPDVPDGAAAPGRTTAPKKPKAAKDKPEDAEETTDDAEQTLQDAEETAEEMAEEAQETPKKDKDASTADKHARPGKS